MKTNVRILLYLVEFLFVKKIKTRILGTIIFSLKIVTCMR